jgi:FHS family glucose/mannose:H+ symporter-like MFS transporter
MFEQTVSLHHRPSALRSTVALSIAFLLTGVATAMLGATLPVMLKEWHLTDTSGGNILLLAWVGSTCGALLFRGNLRRASATGLVLTAMAMLSLAALNRSAALPVFSVYGLGIGIAMTAITLLSSQAADEAARRTIMMRLNLLWSVGACIAPTLATHALTHTRVGGLFSAIGLTFCAAAVAVALSGQRIELSSTAGDNARLPLPPFTLYAMAFLAVGAESAIGGWLTTYAGRTAHSEFITISAISAFWVGLLLSRAVHSLRRTRWLHSSSVLIAHAAIATTGSATLLAVPHSAAFLPSALLAGFGLGPIYPRILAMVVGVYKPRAVFIVAGVGSAALPWLTGSISHAAGSLASGLLVPCIAAAALLLLMLISKACETPPSASPC